MDLTMEQKRAVTVKLVGAYRGAGKKKKSKIFDTVVQVLTMIWESYDYMCGQPLAALLKETLPVIVGTGELYCSHTTYQKLMRISGATIDRLFRPEKEKLRIQGHSHSNPASRLKAQIPILT
jgi:hypothetical protein